MVPYWSIIISSILNEWVFLIGWMVMPVSSLKKNCLKILVFTMVIFLNIFIYFVLFVKIQEHTSNNFLMTQFIIEDINYCARMQCNEVRKGLFIPMLVRVSECYAFWILREMLMLATKDNQVNYSYSLKSPGKFPPWRWIYNHSLVIPE